MNTETTRPRATESDSDSDEETIRTLVSRAQEAQNDTDSLIAMHTPNVVIVNVAGRRVLGREAFAEAMSAAVASPLSEVRTTLEVLDIRFTTPDVAIVSCIKTIHDDRAAPHAALPTTGALTYVMTRSADAWQVALAQTTPRLAAPAADA